MDAVDKVRKLYKLAKDQGPKTPEGRNAWNQAKKLMAKHDLSMEEVFPPKPDVPTIDPLRDPVMNPDGPQPRTKVRTVDEGVSSVFSKLSDLFGLGL